MCVSSSWALIGTPCDPEKDFKKVYLIRNWKQMPHENQEESKARVEEVNKKNIKGLHWKYRPEPNTPIYACLSYGVAGMANWWALELGKKLPKYKSFDNGRIEVGYNPRKLELMYRKRAKWHRIKYLMITRCPVTKWLVPVRPKGYARIITDKKIKGTIVDPVDGITYTYKPSDYPTENSWKAVVSKHWWGKNDAKLIKALHDFGPLYIQFEILTQKYLFGTHAVVCIGYGTLPNGKTAFICHDSFGNFPKNYKQDEFGAPAYRYVLADGIDEAIVFPHTPVVKASKMSKNIIIKVFNKGGKSIPVRRVFYVNNDGRPQRLALIGKNVGMATNAQIKNGKVAVYVEADYYMNSKGKGHWLKVPVK